MTYWQGIIKQLISGGQTGADQAALRAAKAAGIPTGGCAAKGWMTEDGPAPWLADYGLVECLGEPGYPLRTRMNVELASACLWFGNPHSPGGKLTTRLCIEHNIDTFTVISQSTPVDVACWIADGIAAQPPIVLMVAGNRESKSPGIGAKVEAFLQEVFEVSP